MKKLFSRILALVTTVTMLVAAMPVSASALAIISDPSKQLTELKRLTITFVDPLGETVERSVDQGRELSPADWPTPAHAGYRLEGWYSEGAKVETLENIQAPCTLTAQYVRQHTVTYEDWNGDTLYSVVVDEGTAFDASSYNGESPARDGYAFTQWEPARIDPVTSDVTIKANYKELRTFTVTINYVFVDGKTAADPYVASVREGYRLEQSVVSPSILGYICQTPEVAITEPITADHTEMVTYLPSGSTQYTVEYHQQSVDGQSYALLTSETRTGTTGALTTVSEEDASAQLKEGFRLVTDMTACNEHIAADGTTKIHIYYDREIHYVFFNTADGDYIEPLAGLYGAAVTMPTQQPARIGYTFGGWDTAVDTIAAQDVTVTALWTPQDVDYTVVVWRENADDSEYSVLGTLTLSGKTGEAASYTADRFTDKNGKNNIERKVANGSSYETRDYFTFSTDVTAQKNGGAAPLIKGDGSTIYNVYYTRDYFTANFIVYSGQTGGKPATLTLRNGTVAAENFTNFGKPIFSITKKYNQYLNGEYPANIEFEGQTKAYNGWELEKMAGGNANSTTVTSTRARMDPNLCNTAASHVQNYKLQLTDPTYAVDFYYLTECLDGTTYEEAGYYERRSMGNPGQVQSGGSSNNKQIAGFTYVGRGVFTYCGADDPGTFASINVGDNQPTSAKLCGLFPGTDKWISGQNTKYHYFINAWWYSRNKYTITFQNGNLSEKVANVPFDKPLQEYELAHATPVRPAGVGEDYEFIGWYEDAGFAKPVNWDTLIMPASDLVLHACWKKPTYTVTFDYADGTTATVTQEVGKDDKATVLDTPVRDGYVFDYWYYVDAAGNTKPFSFSMTINRPYTLIARWRATSVTYTVRYVSLAAGDGTVYGEDGARLGEQTFSGKVGDTVTVEAPTGFDSASGGHALFPLTLSTSLELTPISENNVIVFRYDRASTVYYKVRYLDENGVELHAASDTIATNLACVTERAVNITGYTPDRYQYTMTLALETSAQAVSQNILVFRYRSNPTGQYTVKYYLQNLNNNQYACDDTATETRTDISLGSIANATIREYEGYTCMRSISKLSGTVYSSNGGGHLLLQVYYNRNYVPYTARFVDIDTQEELGEAVTGTARFGKTATVYAQDFVSYTLDGASSAEIAITADGAQNVYTFQYRQRDDLTYTVRFLDENNLPIADSIVRQYDDNGKLVKLDATYSYTLASAALVSNQVRYHLVDNGGAVPCEKSVTIAEGAANTIDFHFAQDTYTLTYYANGGENAPVDQNAYRADDTVMLAGAGEMVYGQNRFEGWTTDENAQGKVYATEAELAQVVRVTQYTFVKPAQDAKVYAVWSHLTATLTYAAETAYQGTLPQNVTADLNAPITIDSGAGISREGYTFAGWKLKDGATGAYASPAYGTSDNPTLSINVNTTLYATWAPIAYDISYVRIGGNDGWLNPNAASSAYTAESESLTLRDATLAGYRFLGWYTDEAGTQAAGVPAIAKGEMGGRTFYAKFEAIRAQQVSVNSYADVYDGQEHGVTLNDPSGELLPTDQIRYSTSNRYADATDGAQTVNVTVTRDGYTVYEGVGTVSISKRPIAVEMASATTLTYNGSEQETPSPKYAATIYDEQAKVGPLAEQTLSVVPVGDKRTEAGNNAVSATVTVTDAAGGDVTNNYAVTLTEGAITIAQATSRSANTTATHVYNAEPASFELPKLSDSQGNEITDRTLEWKLPTESEWHTGAPSPQTDVLAITNGNAEAYVIDVRLSHRNYQTQTVQAKLTITPAPVKLTADRVTDYPYTLLADGSVKVWSVTGAHYQAADLSLTQDTLYAGDTIRFELANNTQDVIGSHAVTFASYQVADAAHAKNYAITTENGSIAVVRGTEAATLTANGLDFTYNAVAHPMPLPSVSVATEGGSAIDRTSEFTFTYTVDGVDTTALPSFTDAGTYTVTVNATSALHAQPQPVTVSVIVRQATLTLTSGSYADEYDAAQHTVEVLQSATGLVTDGHQLQTPVMLPGQVNRATHAGSYPVSIDKAQVRVLDALGGDVTANYDVRIVAGGLEIAAAPLRVSAVSAYAAYNGQPHTLLTRADGLKGDDALTDCTLTPESAAQTGTYTITPSDALIVDDVTTRDYTISYVDGTLTILDFSVTGILATYDGLEHFLTLDVPQAIADLYNVTYNGSAAVPSFRNVTDETVTVTLTPKSAADGLPTLSHEATVEIKAKQVELQVNRIGKTYDGQPAQLIVTLPQGAAATEDDATTLMNNLTYTNAATGAPLASSAFTDVCNYRVEVSSSCANYTVVAAQTAAVITARPITVRVSPENEQFVYDEQAHDLRVAYDQSTSGEGLLAGHTIDHTGTNLSVTDVTTGWLDATIDTVTIYADAAHSIDVTSNYAITTVDTKVRVNQPDTLTLNLTPYEDVYDGVAHSASVASVKAGEREIDPSRFSWTYNGLATFSATDVSDTQVTVIGTSVDGNYPNVSGTTHVTITRRPITLRVVDSLGNVYSGAPYSAAYDYTTESGKTGLLTGQTMGGVLTGNSQTNEGTYPVTFDENATDITAGGASVKENYEITYRSGTLEILPAQAAAVATSTPYTYDGTAKAFVIPTLTDGTGAPLTIRTVEWRLPGESDWRIGALPQYTRAQSALTAGGQANVPGDYATTPYAVQLRLSADNYLSVETSATLTIQRRAASVSAVGQTFPYDATAHSLTINETGLAQGDTMAYGFVAGGENAWTNVTSLGGHSVRVDRDRLAIHNSANEDVTDCYAVGVTDAAIHITAQATSSAPVETTETYNGGEQNFVMPVMRDAQGAPVTEQVAYQYRDATNPDWTTTAPTYSDVGDYTIDVRMTSANYQPVETTTRLVIEPLEITLHAPTASFPYTLTPEGAEKEWSLSVSDVALSESSNALVAGHQLANITLGTASRSTIGSNEATITAVSVMNGTTDVTRNYQITRNPGSITVSPSTAATAITATPLRETYQSGDYTLTQPTVGVLSEDNATMIDRTAQYRFTYTVTSDAFDGTQTFTGELPHYTDKGTYHITIHAESDSFATPADVQTNMTILPREITITAGSVDEASAFLYDGSEHTVDAGTVTVGELQGVDAISGYTFANGLGNAQTDAADRPVTIESVQIMRGNADATANYTIRFESGRIIVKPLAIVAGLTITGESHVYDGGEHGAVLSDGLLTKLGTFSLANAQKSDGTPRFTVEYTATPAGGAEGARTASAPRFTDVTEQTITAYVTDTTGNLTIAPISAKVRVTPRTVNIAVSSETNIPYDGLAHTLGGYTAERATMTAGVASGDTGLVGADEAMATLGNAGPYTVPNTYAVSVMNGRITAGKADNYTFTYTPGVLQIVPTTGIGLTLHAYSGVYDGRAHGYTVSAQVPEGTQYTYSIVNADNSERDVEESELATYTAAGDYPLTLKIRSPYYTDTAVATVTLHIERRTVTVTAGDNHLAPFHYTGVEQSVAPVLLASGSPYGLVDGESFDLTRVQYASGLSNGGVDVCDRAVLPTGVHILGANGDTTENYTLSYEAGRLVIQPSEASTTAPTTTTANYNGVAHGFIRPIMTDGVSEITGVTYEYSRDGQSFGLDMPTYVDVKRDGSGAVVAYTVYVRMSHENYVTRTTTASLTVLPEALTVQADTRSYPFTLDANGKAVEFAVNTASVVGGMLYESAQATYTFTDNKRSAYGSQSVYVDGVRILCGQIDKTANYDITRESGTLNIGRGNAEVTILADGDTVTYDALAHGIAAPVVTVLNAGGTSSIKTSDFQLAYDVQREGDTQVNSYRRLADVALVDAGTYHITIHASSEQYAAPNPATVDLVILPRIVSITSEDNSAQPYIFTGKEQRVKGDLTADNLVSGHKLTDLSYADGQGNTGTAATDHSVLLSSARVTANGRDVTDNYQLLYRPGRIVILPLAITAADIPLKDAESVYDGVAHGLKLPETIRTGAGTVKLADEFSIQYIHLGAVSTENPTFTDVGEYPVTVRLISGSGNYAPEEVAAMVRILPRPLTIAYGKLSETYNALAHTVARTVDGLTERDAINVTDAERSSVDATRLADGSFGAVMPTASGYVITAAGDNTIDRSANYTVTVKAGSLEVKPIELTVTAATESLVYNAAEQVMADYAVKGAPATGQSLNVRLTGNTAVGVVDRQVVSVAGTTITDAAGADQTRNYSIQTANGALTITPAPLTLGVTTLTAIFDGAAHQPDGYVVGGLQGGDRLAQYALADMPRTEAGTYTVSYDRAATVLRSRSGADVTANYRITYTTGVLTIAQPTASYTIEYYYDGVLDTTATLMGTRGATVAVYPAQTRVGFTFDHAEGVPLTLTENASDNVIRVYYARVTMPELTEVTDAEIPLSGNMASLNVGTAVE